MPVSKITLSSTNGDSVVVSAAGVEWDTLVMPNEIVLDTDPQSMYDVGFKVRTRSGAFSKGGQATGVSVPIREPVLPFHLTQTSRARFQRLWGSPYRLEKVKVTWDGPSGPRWLYLKLAKEILYTTEGGYDAAIDDHDHVGDGDVHAVVSANVFNPMYESPETSASWVNPDDRFTLAVVASAGTFPLTFTPRVGSAATTSGIAYNATAAQVQSALQSLPNVGAGNVTVTGSAATASVPSNFLVKFAVGVNGVLIGSTTGLTGTGLGLLQKSVTIDYAPNTGWFNVWNPTDQADWLEWALDPAKEWQFPDFSYGQERLFNRPSGADAARMIVTPELTQKLSVMSDPEYDTYVNADLSNAAGKFNGVRPLYQVPPYTGTATNPLMQPVVCRGPAGAKVTLRQQRFWSAESGLTL